MTSCSGRSAKFAQDFPILERRVHGKPLVFLDSAASSQKPTCVIDAMDDYYRTTHANVHRGVHTLSEEATEQYEGARKKIAKFINAKSSREIIYTRNATESINLVAYTWGRANLRRGRRDPADRDGASQQHRAVADAGRGNRRRGALSSPSTPKAISIPRRWMRC